MKRAQQITFNETHGVSSFPYPEALLAMSELADEGATTFWMMNHDGKPRISRDHPDGFDLFSYGLVIDAEDGEPDPMTLNEIHTQSRPNILYFKQSGITRVIYPTWYQDREPYTGRVYRQFKSDCYSLMRDYYRDILGIQLPTGTVEEAEALSRRLGRAYLESAFEEYGFTPVAKGRDHDIALIVPDQDIAHIAILVDGGKNILHHPARRLSCLVPYSRHWKRNTVALFRRER